jgi:uncharacterized protein YggE
MMIRAMTIIFPKIIVMFKPFFLALILHAAYINASAQTSAELFANPNPRTVSVTGSAEQEIVPDQIYVLVQLKEYQLKGHAKVSLNEIREQFLKEIHAMGLPDSLVSIESSGGENEETWWRKKKTRNGLYASINYQLLIHSSSQLNDLVARLDDNATERFEIDRVSHTRIIEYRRQLKINAVKAAREKAAYLAEAIGEHIGQAMTITEQTYEDSPAFSSSQMRA